MGYLTGFGNHHQSEAEEGVLPRGQNSPQRVARGLYAEKLSGNAFTAPKATNARSWLYRLQPSIRQLGFKSYKQQYICTAPTGGNAPPPDPLRWDPLPIPDEPLDFVDGMRSLMVNGDVMMQVGCGIHMYFANQSMLNRYFYNADGELMLVPQMGSLRLHTEFGQLDLAPQFIAVIPRGVRFRVELLDSQARGYICENYGLRFDLPERGPIGTDGLANSRDFEYPQAAYETSQQDVELVCKTGGQLYSAKLGHSPLDVVAWHGNLAPYRYNLAHFNVLGSTSYDHPDPSIYTVLTAQSDTVGVANVDFVVFAPRWLVMDNTFRPPWFHRNVMSEFMGLIYGQYDSKLGGGFEPGGASLHNSLVPHGPDAVTYGQASTSELKPQYLDGAMAFMFESRFVMQPTNWAMQHPALQSDYIEQWDNLRPNHLDSD